MRRGIEEMRNMEKLIRNKSGNAIYLVLIMVMCIFFPLMAVIYDLGQYRMYQQDIKNIQEIAGLACVGVAAGSIPGYGGSGSAAGAFEGTTCKSIATNVALANLGLNFNHSVFPTEWAVDVAKNVNHSRLAPCNSGSFNVAVGSANNGHNFTVQLKGLCYYPKFLKKNVLNFQAKRTNKTPFSGKFESSYEIQVRPSVFSAVYQKHE